MGKSEIRYAAKVSLDTPPEEQKVLHVGYTYASILFTQTLICRRTVGIPMVRYPRQIEAMKLINSQSPPAAPSKTARSSRSSVSIGLAVCLYS